MYSARNMPTTNAAARMPISQVARFWLSNCLPHDAKYPSDILRFAGQWTLWGRIADDVMDRLKAVLSSAHLVLLAATSAPANFTMRFNNVFGVELP